MASQLKQLATYLLLLSSFSTCHAKEKPCQCPDKDQRSNHTLEVGGLAFRLIDKESGVMSRVVGLGILSIISAAFKNNTPVLSFIDEGLDLWQYRPDGAGVDEASFSATVVYQPQPNPDPTMVAAYGSLVFLILPLDVLVNLDQANDSLAAQLLARDVGSLNLNTTYRITSTTDNYKVSVAIGTLSDSTPMGYRGERIVGVDIAIEPTLVAANYSVWINYDQVGRALAVYVDVEGQPRPKNAIAEQSLNISSVTGMYAYFALVCTVGQLFGTSRGIDFRGTADDLPAYYNPGKGVLLSRNNTILFSVLGPVAATVLMAIALACYFKLRYRRWHRELDKLARSMQRLPGVPTKVDFADINKATCNFHKTMKLGGGGFGTVYRCTLPATATKMDRPMDVAVKRFTRDVQNQRYDDFLAEVSIINRLRHKNIVPLVGWSYNKGEPLLVFEYMTNGSLDQHLFPKGGSGSGCSAAIRQWFTRYEIIRGIATGLHYVHHEYEPMVLHRDIKASNVMLDSSFRARLGDFGLACTVAIDRKSVTGVGGTWGYIAPEYAMCGKTTQHTDIYALGVLILEVVTGQRALADHHRVVDDDEVHITDRVWRLHGEGRLLECVDVALIGASSPDDQDQLSVGCEAERMLLLGLACCNPNPSDRPTMPDVVQVIAKSARPPDLPSQKPRFVWPPQEMWATDDDSTGTSMISVIDMSTDDHHVSLGLPRAHAHTVGQYASFQLQSAHERATKRHASYPLAGPLVPAGESL